MYKFLPQLLLGSELTMASVLQQEMFRTLNNALSPLGIRVTDLGDGQWSISDGHSLTRFHDGVVCVKLVPNAQRSPGHYCWSLSFAT